ncbi:MAG: hypothetical protein JOZ69_02215 [Myxococcales bacterium]|nr:hypothetical protein [Myxococcales bacterium]
MERIPPETAMRILDSVEHLRASLDYHLARHNLLTANLAHVDTPNFRPLDLQRSTGFDGVLKAALETTQPGHIAQAPGPAGEAWKVVLDSASAAGTDGNGVSLDREAVKIATNQIRYDTLASLVQNELSGLAWAANDGKGA